MRRWHQEQARMRRHRRMQQGAFGKTSRNNPLGYYRKRHAFDCGRTQCKLCHWSKLFGMKTREEEVSDIDMHEQIIEMNKEAIKTKHGNIIFEVVEDWPIEKDIHKSDIISHDEITGAAYKILSPTMDLVESYSDENGDIYVRSADIIYMGHNKKDMIALAPNKIYAIRFE